MYIYIYYDIMSKYRCIVLYKIIIDYIYMSVCDLVPSHLILEGNVGIIEMTEGSLDVIKICRLWPLVDQTPC